MTTTVQDGSFTLFGWSISYVLELHDMEIHNIRLNIEPTHAY